MQKIDLRKIETKLKCDIPQDVELFFNLYRFNDSGLMLCEEDTMLGFESILENMEIKIEENLLPILDNDNSDFAAIYLDGDLKGMVCIIEHDEPDTSPKFLSIWTLFESIKSTTGKLEEDLIDFYDIEKELPLFGSSNSEKKIVELKNKLFVNYKACSTPETKRKTAFRILKFVDELDYEFIKNNLLKSKDMWVQEEVINTIKVKIKEKYLKDVFGILETDKNNPLIATAVMLRENENLKNSFWANEFKARFPEVARSYL